MSVMSGFQDDYSWTPPKNQQGLPKPRPVRQQTAAEAVNTTPSYVDNMPLAVRQALQNQQQPQQPADTNLGFFGTLGELIALPYNAMFMNLPGAYANVARIVTQDSTAMAPGRLQGSGITPVLSTVEEPVFRTANTGIAGSLLLMNTGGNGVRPGEDGFSIGDLGDVYSRVWENRVTPGQAIAANVAGWNELANSVLRPEAQTAIDKWIEAENAKALADPDNERGLNHWLSGFHSDFDLFDERQRDSAFGQGAGRWITGASDAAIYWFVGVDVLAAKAATGIYKSAGTRFLAAAGSPSRRGAQGIDTTRNNLYRHRAGVEKTVEGELADSFIDMTAEQALRHDIVKHADVKDHVARAIGAVSTKQEADLLLLSLLGDEKSFAILSNLSKKAAEPVKQLKEERDHIARILENNPFATPLNTRGDQLRSEYVFSHFGWHTADEVGYFDDLVETATQEAERMGRLTSFISATGKPTAGIGKAEKVGGAVIKGVRVQKKAGSVAGYGRLSPQAQASKAERRLARFNGSGYQHTVLNIFGRGYRFVGLRSAVDRMTTHRQTGTFNYSDRNEFMAELDALLSSTPFLRRIAKRAARGDSAARVTRTLRDGTVVTETIEEFRSRVVNEALEALGKNPDEITKFLVKLEEDMVLALADFYKVSPTDMLEIAAKYSTSRSRVREHLQDHSWLKDGTDVVVLDKQVLTRLREGFTIMDFNYVENVFRLSNRGSTAAGQISSKGRAIVEAFDGLWRPLVLLRLGYTQRNVAEGWLRTLAAMGEIPTSGSVAQSSKFFMMNAGDRLAGTGSTIKRAVLNRRGLRKARRESDRERKLMQDDLNRREGAKKRVKKSQGRIKRRRNKAKRDAQERVLNKAREGMVRSEKPVYEQIADEVTEAQFRLIEDADTLIYAEGEVFSLHARGLTVPDPSTGVGVADAEALTRRSMGSEAQDLADQVDVYEWMTPGMQRQWDELTAAQRDEMGNWASPEAAEQAESLMLKAYVRRANQLLKSDHRIGRIDESGQFKRIRSDKIGKLTLDDFLSGSIVAVPKSVNPQYAKVDVYGGMLDLRTNVQSQAFNMNLAQRKVRSVMGEGGGTTEMASDLDASLRLMVGDELVDSLSDTGMLSLADALLTVMDESPQMARALAVNKWFRDNADRLPEGFMEWAKRNRLLLDNKEIARLTRRNSKLAAQQRLLEDEAEVLRVWLEDLSNYPTDRIVHGGTIIKGNVAKDVLVTSDTMNHLVGPGLYSSFDSPNTASTYLVFRSSDGKNPGAVYLLPDPSDYAWIYLDDATYDAAGEMNPVVSDMIQALKGDRFVITDKTELRSHSREGSDLDVRTLGDYIESRLEAGLGSSVGDVYSEIRRAARDGAFRVEGGAPEDDVYDVIDAIRSLGYDGVSHFAGPRTSALPPMSNQHFIWWTKDLPLTPVDEINDQALKLFMTEARIRRIRHRLGQSQASQKIADSAALDARSMTTAAGLQADNITLPNARVEQLLTKYARERGYGGVYIDDPGTVEGYRALFTPDTSSLNSGYLDSMIPGQVAAAGRGNAQVVDLSRARGKQATEPPPPDKPDAYDFDDFADYRAALKEWEEAGGVDTPNVPASAQADTTTNFTLQQLKEQDPTLYRAVTGTGSLSKNNKARLAIWMQRSGYTHVMLPGGKGKEPVLVSASELVADRKTGLAYLRYGAQDEVDEVFTSILSKDPEYEKMLVELDEAKRLLDESSEAVKMRQSRLRELGRDIEATRKSRFKKRRVGDSGNPEADRVTFTGARGEATLETGSYRDPNEALAGKTQAMWSSGTTQDQMISGRIQNSHSQIQSSAVYRTYTPGDDHYWDAMEFLINRQVREEPIMRRIAARPRVVDEKDIDMQNADIIEELLQDPAFMKAANDGKYNLDSLPQEINEIRETVYRWVPDHEVLNEAARRPLDADYMRARMNWRDDLVAIEERSLDEVDGWLRRGINRAMNALGTMPEDALIKGPFYRKRWTEEMQRQVNAAEEVGQTSFTAGEIDTMRRQAHAYALKTTREVTYTVSRLSSPAAAMAFIIPFFPAWENAVRFWAKSFVGNPSTLARYIQLWNAPNAMGMVVDEDGNPIEGRRGFGGLADALVSPGESYLVLPVPEWSKSFLDHLPFIGLGEKGELRVAKGALNVALQGDYPWMANAGPLVSVPISYIAAQNPDYFGAIKDFEPGGVKIGDALSKMVVPFGRPTAEKDILSAFAEQALPAAGGRALTLARSATPGMALSDERFVATVEEIHRDRLVDWELRGRPEGERPQYDESIIRARELAALQLAGNLLAPAAPGYQSKYQTEIEEWRRILAKHLDIEETYKSLGITPSDPDEPIGYRAALKEFLNTYGDAFFALTQSTSGRSGVGASQGEFAILKDHGALAGKLAESDINGNADFAAMITSPYQGEFDESVYAWQLNRQFDNSQELMRGGERDDIQVKTEIQRGWLKWTDGINSLEAIAEERGTTVERDPELSFLKKLLEADIAETNPAWYIAKGDFETRGYIKILENVEMILNDDEFMKAHGNEPIWVDVRDWYEAREDMTKALAQRKIELGDQGSLRIDAKSNADLKYAWEIFIEEKKRANIAFAEYYNRWLDYDQLLPGDPSEIIETELAADQFAMSGGGVR